jgi:hypothetical protein
MHEIIERYGKSIEIVVVMMMLVALIVLLLNINPDKKADDKDQGYICSQFTELMGGFFDAADTYIPSQGSDNTTVVQGNEEGE